MSLVKHIRRMRRFVTGVWLLRGLIFRNPVVWHNLRAAWAQADPDWLTNAGCMDLTDAEWDSYMETFQ